MRFLTVVLSILLGVALCAMYINNGHLVRVNFGPFFSGPAPALSRTEPLWVVMFACVALGVLVGYLYGLTGSSRSHAGRPGAGAGGGKPPEDVDYLIGVNRRGRQ